MIISPLPGYNKWTKCHPLLWFVLMTLGIQKVAMDLCVSPIYVLVLGGGGVTLNSAFVSVEYNQIIKLYFGEQGVLLQILINKPKEMMCYFP